MEDIANPTETRVRRPDQRREARRRLLEAAIQELATSGLRGLTHRRLEQRAGLAQGSAKYYFGSSEALIEAVLTHLVDRDLPLVLEVTPQDEQDATQGKTEDLMRRAQQVADAMLADPDEVRARFELYLYAAGRPRLQALVAAARDRFVDRIGVAMPGPDSEAAARFVCAVVDGILLGQVCAPDPTVDSHLADYLIAAGSTGRLLARRSAQEPQD